MDIPSSRRGGFHRAVWLCAVVGFSSTACGNRIPPPGGPVDDIPPKIVSIEPDSNRVNVAQTSTIRIEFDEEIMPSRSRSRIRLQPLHRDLEERDRRRAIEVRAEEGFFPDCTYSVELSGEVTDLRGNRLSEPLRYRFTTGDSIHRGVVTGTFDFPDSLKGPAIFQATRLADSLVYRTPVTADKVFRLSHLPRGRYSFLAFVDIDRDDRYEPLTDPWVEDEGEVTGGTVELELELKGSSAEEDKSPE